MKCTRFGNILELDARPVDFVTLPEAAIARIRLAHKPCGRVPVICALAQAGWSANQLANLAETVFSLANGGPVALVAQGRTAEALRRAGLSQLADIRESVEAARSLWGFRPHSLSDATALILAAGEGTRARPLTRLMPKPMLPVLGTPLIEHVFAHLAGFGIADIHINTGYMEAAIRHHFDDRRHSGIGPRPTLHAEGRHEPAGWVARPLGSAATLARLAGELGPRGPMVVLCGDALTDIDLAQAVAMHRKGGRAATVALRRVPEAEVHRYGIAEVAGDRVVRFVEKPAPHQTESRLASAGIYVFEPEACAAAGAEPGTDIGTHLLPLLAARGELTAHVADFAWADVGCPRDLFAANRAALDGMMGLPGRQAVQLRPGLWAEPGAEVDAAAIRLEGCAYMAAGARVAPGAWLRGACVIGAGVEVAERTLLADSLLVGPARVLPGAIVNGMIAWAEGALRHALADGRSEPPAPPLERVCRPEGHAKAEPGPRLAMVG